MHKENTMCMHKTPGIECLQTHNDSIPVEDQMVSSTNQCLNNGPELSSSTCQYISGANLAIIYLVVGYAKNSSLVILVA